MPWKCPACESAIQHDGAMPDPSRLYRCSVCRLELAFDPVTLHMDVLPFQDTADRPPDPPNLPGGRARTVRSVHKKR
jgi:hypothetical protein